MIVRDDPIVEETRAARRELHDEFGGDMAAFFRYLKQLEVENADRLIQTEPKRAIKPNRKASQAPTTVGRPLSTSASAQLGSHVAQIRAAVR
jgi:hypothetical protein